MAEQSTTMVLKVDLQCCKCYKKVKKVLCKFPDIRDQVYDVKQNTVTIKVVCCCPETLKQKILCKAGKFITSIDIKPPETTDKNQKPEKQPTETPEKQKTETSQKQKTEPSQQQKTEPSEKQKALELSTQVVIIFPPKSPCRVPCTPDHGRQPVSPPTRDCCSECSGGHGGGPCFQPLGCRRPPCYDGRCSGNQICDGCRSRCGYFYEENPSACRNM